MPHTSLQLSAIAPKIMTLSRREPTCRISKYLNLGERRSPTWSNGRYRPSSSLPASACRSTRVRQREAYRVYCQHHSKLRHAIPRSDLVTLSYISASSIPIAPIQARSIEPRSTRIHNCVLFFWMQPTYLPFVSPHSVPLPHVYVAIAYSPNALSAMERRQRQI
jgi:hypothetical protein